jgi:predicted nucleic acid-binding protein
VRSSSSFRGRFGCHSTGLSYDAQIWAVARLGQVGVVLSEDFNPGAVLDGVSFTNPLEAAFDLAALG